MADSFQVLQDTGSPWHSVFGVPVFAILQSFPGASAVMEGTGSSPLGQSVKTFDLNDTYSLNPLTNQYKSTRMSVHPATMYLLYELHFCLTLYIFLKITTHMERERENIQVPMSTGFLFTFPLHRCWVCVAMPRSWR